MLHCYPNYKVTVLPLFFKNPRDVELENYLVLYALESLSFVKHKKSSVSVSGGVSNLPVSSSDTRVERPLCSQQC